MRLQGAHSYGETRDAFEGAGVWVGVGSSGGC